MMNKFNIKKYTIVLFVCFLSFFGMVLATKNETYSATLAFGNGTFIDKTKYENLRCDSGANGTFAIEETDKKVYIKYSNPLDNGTKDVITCTFDRRTDSLGDDGGTIAFTVTSNNHKKITVGTSVDIVPSLHAGATIVSVDVNDDGREYITLNCPVGGTSCSATPTQQAIDLANDGASFSSSMKVTYSYGGHEFTADVIVNGDDGIFNGARAYPGALGRCDFDSNWQARSWQDSAGRKYSFYQTSGNGKLPSCDAAYSKMPVTFKGWKKAVDDGIVYAKGECSGALSAGSAVEDGASYSACYEMEPFVQLAADGGSISDLGVWTPVSGNNGYITTKANAKLPTVVYNGFNADRKFIEWVNKTTGQTAQPGTPVTLDGSIWEAHYEISYVVNKDMKKTLYVGETKVLSTKGIQGCNSANSGKVTANWVNGECQVGGISETSENEYIDVTAMLEDGSSVIFKFSVKTGIGENQGGDNPFVIDTTTKTHTGISDNTSNNQSFISSSCGGLTVTGAQPFTSYGGIGTGTIYNVTPDPECENKGYVAFCLDPGRLGPSNLHYSRTDDIKGSIPFRQLLTYIVKKYPNYKSDFTGVSNPNRIAAHVAIRAVAIREDGTMHPEDGAYASHYMAYKDIADAIPNGCGNGDVSGAVNAKGVVNGGDVIDILNNYQCVDLDDDGLEFDREIYHRKVEMINGGKGYTITYDGIIIAPNDVKFTSAPDNFSARGASGEVVEWNRNDELSTQEGTEVYNYVIKITAQDATAVDPPLANVGIHGGPREDNVNEEKKEVSFKINFSGGSDIQDYFIANPDGGQSYQRMFMFNVGAPDIYVYFSIVPNCDIPALDYKKLCDENGCDAGFNQELFAASGCCSDVTDENKYEYLIDNYCANSCVASTMASVCSFNPTQVGDLELYIVKEGASYSGREGNRKLYNDKIGTCIANVTDKYDPTNKTNFEFNDAAGNKLNVSSYNSNRYCQVTCREEWEISMESFGNYIGEKAVAAGTYFSTADSDIFIGGSRTCYSTFIDTIKYQADVVDQSAIMNANENIYALHSHIWTDAKKQKEDEYSEANIDVNSVRVCKDAGPCDKKGDHDTGLEDYDEDGAVCGYWYYGTNPNNCGSDGESPCPLDQVPKETDTYSSCKTWGVYFEYGIKQQKKVDGGKYEEWTFQDNNTTSNTSGKKVDYTFNEDIKCTYNKGAHATVTCNMEGYAGEGSENICVGGKNGSELCDEGELGTDGNKKIANDDMTEAVMKKAEGIIDGAKAQMVAALRTIHSLSGMLYNCQHFQLHNTTDDGRKYVDFNGNEIEYKNNEMKKGDYLDHTGTEFVKIPTAFEPTISYRYEEKEFMTILNNDNILVENYAKNDSYFGGNGSFAQSTDDEKDAQLQVFGDSVGNTVVSSADVKLSRNKISEGHWTSYSLFSGDDVMTYGGGEGSSRPSDHAVTFNTVFCHANGSSGTFSPVINGYEWKEGQTKNCYTMAVYYPNTYYVRATLENSSFYKNKGQWYMRSSDVKEHGDTKVQALENAMKRDDSFRYPTTPEELDRWSLMGGTNRQRGVNVFPISLTTPRNLYQYSYTFGSIGSTYDGKLGRIMGDETSLIPLNTRSCFYEVYEELCLCCGSKINVHIEDDNSTNDYLNDNPGIGYKPSDPGKLELNDDGTLSFATSTISLGDLDSGTGRQLGVNWSPNSPFLYSGVTYFTNKGDELIHEIETKGETIYDDAPEYSYYLTPATLSAIKEYNDQYGYEVAFNSLIPYGVYSIEPIGDCSSPGSCTWNSTDRKVMDEESIIFQHYGSKFLEEFMWEQNAVYDGTLATSNYVHNNDCFVTAGNVNDVTERVQNGCRWVDYIDNAKTNNPTTYDPKYFRLSFK